ncbi:MAG: zinc-ribbon domain-containing protein [Actinobacteria bacterium]|nr:MAG: zinc-ribbon domain-containing protein [Actinomycetota bacterium]
MTCTNCGTENKPGRKFCANCGVALSTSCPACGAANDPTDRFCGECGTPLATGVAPDERAAPVAERRLVSVLFMDLVGFTAASESRDAEDVRDLLSRYFDVARTVVGRYGGTIEKFIGDAVMAVWGTPITREDDAERAVRSALDLVAAIPALGAEAGVDDLAARAGVATGETAVTLDAEGQGMVAGDIVNTASRVQSAAPPGGVFVTEATRHATDAAIAYEEAGQHELKGKSELLTLHHALRVVALRGGQLRSTGLESPFVGRERELRLVKELFHASADQRRTHLMAVTGVAGIGKSRLGWEFFKYVDGLADDVYWHRGRCIAYGEGVTYWALAEMVRGRAGIAEEEVPTSAAEKLSDMVARFVGDMEERRWIEGRLAQLLGLEDRVTASRDDLFAAWRRFVERIAQRGPVVLVFEDLQWADPELLDFIEHLLDWSRDQPIFVLGLARPEIVDRRTGWGTGRRGVTSLFLEPLDDATMEALLRGMVPGLPEAVGREIRERSEGIPLYAVETVRMLLDRGLLRRDGDRFEPTGPIENLDVPETLHTLIQARLDGLVPEDRALLQDASVLGKTFPPDTLAALTGRDEHAIRETLEGLVRREFLAVQTDERSPERGQFGFLQSLMQRVAYETLARRDRKAKHLAIARLLEDSWAGDDDEIVEVIASHYLEAYRADPDAEDAQALRANARVALARAGDRARALAAARQARGYYQRAAELAEEPSEEAGLLEQIGMTHRDDGDPADALAAFERSHALFSEEGLHHDAARLSARMGEALWLLGRPGRILFFLGRLDDAWDRLEVALRTAEAMWLPDVLSEALNTKALVLSARDRPEESLALLTRSLELAREGDVPHSALRAYSNLSNHMMELERWDDAGAYQEEGGKLAERVGFRSSWWFLQQHVGFRLMARGRWDEMLAMVEALPAPEDDPAVLSGRDGLAWAAMQISARRGQLEAADRYAAMWIRSETDVQSMAGAASGDAERLLAGHQVEAALERGRFAFDSRNSLSLRHGAVKDGFRVACEAALELGDGETLTQLLAVVEAIPPGLLAPSMRATRDRMRGHMDAIDGRPEDADRRFRGAAQIYGELGMPFERAVVLLDRVERFGVAWPGAEDDLREASQTFEDLGAAPRLERARTVASG